MGGRGVNDDQEKVSGTRAATAESAESAESAAGVVGAIPGGQLNRNGTEMRGGEGGGGISCLAGAVAVGGEEGGAAAGRSGSAGGPVKTSKEESAGVPVPAAGLPMPATVVEAEAQPGTAGGEVAVEPGCVDTDVGGVGDSRGSSTSTSGPLETAALDGGATTAGLKEGRTGLLRLPIDGDEGVVGAAA